jgi:hypothetical protein
LDIVGDAADPGDTRLLVSTTGYPIGDLIEEFTLGDPGGNEIFQPHVPGQPSIGPSYGEAYFINRGMDVLFLAATNTSGGNYDYNVFSMSDATGTEIKQLTHFKGMTAALKMLPDGKVSLVNGGTTYLLDIKTQAVEKLR